MAADILLYHADLVPVGEDQVQHLELTREIARKWNAEFGGGEAYFAEPKPLLTEAKRIMGLDGQAKMSKSLGNTIGLLDTPEEIWQKLRPAPDRSGAGDEEGSGQPGDLQHLPPAPVLLAAGDGGEGGGELPRGEVGLPRLQAGAGRQHDRGAGADPGPGPGAAGSSPSWWTRSSAMARRQGAAD